MSGDELELVDTIVGDSSANLAFGVIVVLRPRIWRGLKTIYEVNGMASNEDCVGVAAVEVSSSSSSFTSSGFSLIIRDAFNSACRALAAKVDPS